MLCCKIPLIRLGSPDRHSRSRTQLCGSSAEDRLWIARSAIQARDFQCRAKTQREVERCIRKCQSFRCEILSSLNQKAAIFMAALRGKRLCDPLKKNLLRSALHRL